MILASTTSAISPILLLLKNLLKISPTIAPPIAAKMVHGKNPNLYALAKYIYIIEATNAENRLI